MKCKKKILSLDDAGWSIITIEVNGGIDEAGYYEEKQQQIEVEHL